MTQYEKVVARFAAKTRENEAEQEARENSVVGTKYLCEETINLVATAKNISNKEAEKWIREMAIAKFRSKLRISADIEEIDISGAKREAGLRKKKFLEEFEFGNISEDCMKVKLKTATKDAVLAERLAEKKEFEQLGLHVIEYEDKELFGEVIRLHDSLKRRIPPYLSCMEY